MSSGAPDSSTDELNLEQSGDEGWMGEESDVEEEWYNSVMQIYLENKDCFVVWILIKYMLSYCMNYNLVIFT